MNPFSVTNKLDFRDYLLACYQLTYSKPWMRLTAIYTILFIVTCLLLLIKGQLAFFDSVLFLIGSVLGLIGLYIPIILLVAVRIKYIKQASVGGLTRYEFSDSGINITGEDYSTRLNWEKVKEIKVLDGWLCIYDDKKSPAFIKLNHSQLSCIHDLNSFLRLNYKGKLHWLTN
jgi:hypothetical protein